MAERVAIEIYRRFGAEVSIVPMQSAPDFAIYSGVRHAFERAGVIFVGENGGGPGVRLRKRKRV